MKEVNPRHRDSLGNRADIQPGGDLCSDTLAFDCCREELVFAMKDNEHTFSMGLTTVLQCLIYAEHQGYVPELPDGWWRQLMGKFNLHFEE